ncbi:hypothetical protein EJ08DRAFT_52783 [Tothia fuscella]|uniref:BTB domain-containing protein n=1 Tax=Tothia fuscella TaxID=1048955 RepID=A0A9P4NF62_9PEZI|nr:hypothetical protein EJ08DRAFT_52783 [Tothia fuscella]
MPIQTSKNKRGNQQEEVQPQATKKKRGNEQEEAPSPARVRDLYNYMVKLVVTSKDGDAEEFDLFQGVLCQKSPYFRHLVDPDRAKTVHKVPGVDPAIFAYFKEWVVVGEFIFDLATHWETSGNNVYIPLIELWLLSQKFEVPGLANLTVSELLKFMRERKEAVTSTQPQYTTFTDAQRQMKNLSSSELFSWITTLQWYVKMCSLTQTVSPNTNTRSLSQALFSA